MSVVDHKCPNCFAELKFNPTEQKWVCNFCGCSYMLEDLKKAEEELNKATKDESVKENLKKSANVTYSSYNCPDCGAEIVMDENTSVTECIYCGNTAIITERLTGEFMPKQIIPFKKEKDEAIKAYKSYSKGKWFVPKEFTKDGVIQKISGIYIPFYLYDMNTSARITVDARRDKTWTEGGYRYKRTDYFVAERAGKMSFRKIPTDASQKFPDDIMDSIEPYNYSDLVDFDSSYMSGFLSEKYDLSKDELLERAEQRAKESTVQELLNTVTGYNSKNITASEAHIDGNVKGEYVLLPVWLLNVKYDGKMYTFAMNGQTGKFIGNVPVLASKVAGYWFGIFGAISAILILLHVFGIL